MWKRPRLFCRCRHFMVSCDVTLKRSCIKVIGDFLPGRSAALSSCLQPLCLPTPTIGPASSLWRLEASKSGPTQPSAAVKHMNYGRGESFRFITSFLSCS